jgi:hypothetical protein
MHHSKRDQAILDEKATVELLMPKQVAALLGIRRNMLPPRARRGNCRPCEITGGYRRYWRSDVERLLAKPAALDGRWP